MGKKSKNLNLNKIILRWEIKIQIIILTQDKVMNERKIQAHHQILLRNFTLHYIQQQQKIQIIVCTI